MTSCVKQGSPLQVFSWRYPGRCFNVLLNVQWHCLFLFSNKLQLFQNILCSFSPFICHLDIKPLRYIATNNELHSQFLRFVLAEHQIRQRLFVSYACWPGDDGQFRLSSRNCIKSCAWNIHLEASSYLETVLGRFKWSSLCTRLLFEPIMEASK